MAKNSSKLTYGEFQKKLAAGDVDSIYLFAGNQIYLMEQALSELKQKTLGDGGADFNFSLFYGDAAKSDEIINAAKTYPMLSRRRLIVVRNADKLPPSEMKSLEAYAASPSPYSCLVFISEEEKKIGISGLITTVVFKLDEAEIPQAIRTEARRLGFEITKDAADLLHDYIGESLLDIQSELQKLSLFASGKKRIEASDVKKLTEKSQFEDVFALLKAVVERNKSVALRVMSDLERAGEEPLVILSTIGRRLNLIWRAKELMEAKTDEGAILKELKISPGAFYYIKQDAKKLSLVNAKRAIGIIYEADRRLKTGSLPKGALLTKIVLELCD